MKRKIKSILSVMLTLAMVITMLPMNASAGSDSPVDTIAETENVELAEVAAEDNQEGVPVVEMDGTLYTSIKDALWTLKSADTTVHTLKVLENHEIDVNYSTYNYPILVNGFSVILDLNGKTITADWSKYTGSREDNALIGICNGGKLTVVDSVGGGQIINESDNKDSVQNRIFWAMTGTATKELVLTIEGGTFVQNDNVHLLYVQGNKPADNLADVSVYIKGGHYVMNGFDDFFNAYDDFEQTTELSGGTFNVEPKDLEMKTAEGFEISRDAENGYSVKKETIKVATKDELDEALKKAVDGDIIEFTADIDYTGTSTLIIDKAITLDLGGKTFTTHGTYGGLQLKNNCSIKNGTLNHQGTVTAIKAWNVTSIEDLDIVVDFKAEGKVIGGIVIQEGSANRIDTIKNVTIKGEGLTNGIETYNCGNATQDVIGSMENVEIDAKGTGMLISAPCGTATDCKIKGATSGIEIWIKGKYSASLDLVKCTVEGGTQAVYAHDEFNSNPSIVNNGTIKLTADDATAFVSENAKVTKVIARVDEEDQVILPNTLVEGAVAKVVTENTEKYYETFTSAVEAANAIEGGATVELLKDVTLGEKLTISGNVTISGEHTITRDDAYTGTLFAVNAGASFTLDGGLVVDGANNYEFDADDYTADLNDWQNPVPADESAKWFTPEEGAPVATAYMITTSGILNLKDVAIKNHYSTNGSGIVSAGTGANVTLDGVQITHCASTAGSGLVVNASAGVWSREEELITVTMNEGTVIDGNHVGGNHGIFKIYMGTYFTMNGGEIKNTTGWNSNGVAIGIYHAVVTMNGGTICSNSSVYGPNNGRNAAIYGHSNHLFTMNDGTICHNTGRSKAGIDSPYSETGYTGLTTVNGGSVLDNTVLGTWTEPDVSGGATLAITGGTFTQDVNKWAADGFVAIKTGDGIWGVVPEKDLQTVNLVIYRNGNTSKPYKTVSLPKVLKGTKLNLEEIDINEYYSSANGFKMDGYFNDGGWNNFVAGKNPAPMKEITVNGWTNIKCMVTDYEKVIVKAVVDGEKNNAVTIYEGKALKGSNLGEFLDNNVDVEERAGYELDKWFNWDWYGHKIADDATVNGWTNVYVTYTDVTAPTFHFENTSGEPLACRTVTLVADEPIQAPEGWTPVEGSNGTKWTKDFIENTKVKNFTVTDLAGNVSEAQTLDVKNVDSSEPAGAVTYSPVDPTNGDVIVTLKTNTDCETPDGWTKVNWREFTKVYTANGNESFTLTSRTGVDATEPVIVNVNNIDKEAPTFTLENTSGDPAQSRTVTLKASEAILSPDEGWEPVEGSDGKEWTKTFEENTKVEGFTVTDLVGNVSEAQTLEVTDIDTKAPAAEVSYSTTEKTTGTVTVTIVTDEAVTLDGEGWIAAADATGNQFQKVYEANGEETVVLTDAAGNYAVAEVSVQNIVAPEEPKAPEAPSDNDVEDEEVENEDAEVEESGEDRAPETGDSANIMGYVFVMVAALGVAIMAIIKKRNA